MFLLSFALSIAMYTIFLNAKLGITISLVLFGIFLVGSGIFCLIRKRKKAEWFWKPFWKFALFVFLWNFLALLVVCGSLRRKDTEFLKRFWWIDSASWIAPSSASLPPRNDSKTRQRLNSFWTITDTQKYHTYLFEDEEGKVWRLSSNRTYHIGDQLFLSASIKALDTSVVFDRTFIPPRKAEFWDYQFNYDKWIFMKGIDGTAYEKTALWVNPEQQGTMNGKSPPEKNSDWLTMREQECRAMWRRFLEKISMLGCYWGCWLGTSHWYRANNMIRL